MISKGNIDQRERKREQGQAAAFYSSTRQQAQRALSGMCQVQACGTIG